jgi:hypothetical protein
VAVDTTVIRLLDGTDAYVFAVIDDYSRRILSFRVADRIEIGHTIAALVEAARGAVGVADGEHQPLLVVDGGVEDFNRGVDELISKGVLRRVLALSVDCSYAYSSQPWLTARRQASGSA